MAKINPENERAKHAYFDYLRHAKRRSEPSVDTASAAIARFEEANGYKSFKAFRRQQAVAFKTKLSAQINARTGKRLSRATVHTILTALREFFIWIADRPGYRSRIAYADAEYFNLTEKEARVAKAMLAKPVPTLEQIHHVIAQMPHVTDIEKRDRAVVAFTILTGARDGAIVSFRLKHLDLVGGRLDQDAREVSTKFSKTFPTWFFPVGGEALAVVTDWVAHLRSLHWGDDDPLFPATKVVPGPAGGFTAAGLDRRPWSTASRVRAIFRTAFEAAALPYFNPHAFRDTLAVLGERVTRSPEEFKAWSQNLGHEGVLTTFSSYGAVPARRQSDIMRELAVRVAATTGGGEADILDQIQALISARSAAA
jgi:integrase